MGLAIYAEEQSGLLSEEDLKKYCFRIIASAISLSNSFSTVYRKLLDYTGPDESYAITLRVKRGLADTSIPGGYTKDQVYFSGYQKIKRLKRSQIEHLFVGKIGIKNLDELKVLRANPPASYPSWLQD